MDFFTEDIPVDLIFEDQIGARFMPFDHNATSPKRNGYAIGWLEHTRTYSHNQLMTEYGADYLAGTEVGFHGTVLTAQREGSTAKWWGNGNWRPIPLAAMMMRDKVLLYQHNLDEKTATHDLATLMWNASFGTMLTFDLLWLESDPEEAAAWLEAVAVWQQVFARYAGERVTAFSALADQVTKTSFETITVVSNWDQVDSARIDDHTIPPHGFLVESLDSSLRAGIFSVYNDAILSEGNHHIVEERTPTAIRVWQPLGSDTDITLDLPVGLIESPNLLVSAYNVADVKVGEVPSTRTKRRIKFRYRQNLLGEPVNYFLVESAED